jgi:hypothetical protein
MALACIEASQPKRPGAHFGGSVNFITNSVAAVFLSDRPNAGYGVEIREVTRDASLGRITVHVIEWLPDPKTFYSAVVLYPADIVAFPAPSGTVEFVRSKKIRTD